MNYMEDYIPLTKYVVRIWVEYLQIFEKEGLQDVTDALTIEINRYGKLDHYRVKEIAITEKTAYERMKRDNEI